MLQRTLWRPVSFCSLLFFLAAGCSSAPSDQPALGTVTGTITMDEQPLSGAIIVFKPQSGRPSAGLTDESGQYELFYVGETKGAVIGTHSISITTMQDTSSEEEITPTKETIPAQYNTKSTLQENVKAGDNVFDFKLTSK